MSKFDCRHAALGLLAALVFFGSGKAEAELVVNQTTVQPTGDPAVILDFQLALNPDTYLSNSNSIELFNIPDVVTTPPRYGPFYSYMIGNTDYSGDFNVNTTSNGDGTFDITMTFNTSPSSAFDNSNGSGLLSIGDLYVLTTFDYPPGGPPPGSPVYNTIHYNSIATHSSGSSDPYTGSTTPALVVPEPASVALIGLGMASAWLVARRQGKSGVSPLAS